MRKKLQRKRKQSWGTQPQTQALRLSQRRAKFMCRVGTLQMHRKLAHASLQSIQKHAQWLACRRGALSRWSFLPPSTRIRKAAGRRANLANALRTPRRAPSTVHTHVGKMLGMLSGPRKRRRRVHWQRGAGAREHRARTLHPAATRALPPRLRVCMMQRALRATRALRSRGRASRRVSCAAWRGGGEGGKSTKTHAPVTQTRSQTALSHKASTPHTRQSILERLAAARAAVFRF